jgi:hypothetical protein
MSLLNQSRATLGSGGGGGDNAELVRAQSTIRGPGTAAGSEKLSGAAGGGGGEHSSTWDRFKHILWECLFGVVHILRKDNVENTTVSYLTFFISFFQLLSLPLANTFWRHR